MIHSLMNATMIMFSYAHVNVSCTIFFSPEYDNNHPLAPSPSLRAVFFPRMWLQMSGARAGRTQRAPGPRPGERRAVRVLLRRGHHVLRHHRTRNARRFGGMRPYGWLELGIA